MRGSTPTSGPELRVWAACCSHVGTDLRVAGRQSLADAIRHSEDGGAEGGPPFAWDICLHLGDLSGSQTPPDDEEGAEVVRQFRARSASPRCGTPSGGSTDCRQSPRIAMMNDAMNLGRHKHLMLDDSIIDSSQGVVLRSNPARATGEVLLTTRRRAGTSARSASPRCGTPSGGSTDFLDRRG